jgi:hypothetical protein
MIKPPRVAEAPYNRDGDLMHSAYWDIDPDTPKEMNTNADQWRPNNPMQMRLRFKRYRRTKTTIHSEWEDDQGHVFPMFVADVFEMMPKTIITGGTVTGWWIVARRGSNYGIRFLSAYRPDGV